MGSNNERKSGGVISSQSLPLPVPHSSSSVRTFAHSDLDIPIAAVLDVLSSGGRSSIVDVCLEQQLAVVFCAHLPHFLYALHFGDVVHQHILHSVPEEARRAESVKGD